MNALTAYLSGCFFGLSVDKRIFNNQLLMSASFKMNKVFFILLLISSLAVQSQTHAEKNIFHYGLKDGLSFGIVNSITQDNKGFIWIATSDGLNRFDGHSFTVFKNEPNNPYGIASNHVQSVFKDSQGLLWISSRNGLTSFDTGSQRFIRYNSNGKKPDKKDDITCVTESRDNNLWVATAAGFYYFNKKNKKFTPYNTGNLKGLNTNSILNIYEDSKGFLWVGTNGFGIQVFAVLGSQVKRQSKIIPPLPEARINKIFEDKDQNVWVATSNGLALYSRKLNSFQLFNGHDYNLPGNIFLSVIENGDKEILVGLQDGGLYKVASSQSASKYQFEPVKDSNGSLVTKWSVQTLFLDKDKNIWLGTYGNGIFMVNSIPKKFRKFQIRKDLEGSDFVRFYGLTQDNEGLYWLGTDGDGIFKVTKEGKILKNYRADGRKGSITDNAVLSALKDSRDRLWFGTYKSGLMRYDKKSDAFQSFSYNSKSPGSLKYNDVRVIYEDSKQNIWVGTNGGGLNLFDLKTETFDNWNPDNSEIASNDVRAITEDSSGNLFVGTYGGGVNYYDVRRNAFFKLFETSAESGVLVNNVVYALYLDKEGQLWIGAEGDGLVIYNTKTKAITKYNEKNGLANNTVYSIKADAQGNVWLSTNKGISKVDGKTRKIYNYDESDGLQGGQFHEGSALVGENGNYMLFGGTEGCNFFDPGNIKPSKSAPKVLITGLNIYGQPTDRAKFENIKDITEASQIELNPDQPVFSINYLTLNYGFPHEGEYAYKLEGLDKEWNFVKGQRSATYRYLAPGTYIFKVKASNEDGIWADTFSSISVVILPPWYKTWWAYLIYAGLIGVAIYSLILYRTRQARLKFKVKAAQFEAEKEKELHEKKINFFTNVSHEFRTPLTLIINPAKELLHDDSHNASMGNLNTIYRNARRLLSLVDQLLLFRKSESEMSKLKLVKLNISSVCQEVYLCFTHQARKKNIDLSFETANNSLEIIADREKMEIILFNLISNALKNTPEKGSITIKVLETDQDVLIEISDTGIGIPEIVGERIFQQFYQVQNNSSGSAGGFGIGLSLVKSFVESHKGCVSYESKTGQGTKFSVLFKKGKEHFKDAIIFEELHESSVFLEELVVESQMEQDFGVRPAGNSESTEVYSDDKRILIVDDNVQIRQYVKQLFEGEFEVLEAENGDKGLETVKKYMPDLVISDIMMQGISGIELCSRIKDDPALNHIPVILLTASSSDEVKLKGIECGAEDFISKPFEKEMLIARVAGILKNRNDLQNYFFNHITLKPDNSKISDEYKQFLDRCIRIVEENLSESQFGIKVLADRIGMSRSTLYSRIKSISGQSPNEFIRFIRLRKAAEMFISTECTVSEAAYKVGIKDIKHFREQFNKVFGMNPSEYMKKYRRKFHTTHTIR
ncbi:two-component regulator propeller domain-containing protein [Pedobacter sp. P351]|uniref:hybrid sensor histidine kinase/response regulator transcription factor n=1 Tax=Pedobacter superstes TaxID=3133441 RepID=UPI0030989D50